MTPCLNWVGTALGEGAVRAADGIRVDVAVLDAPHRAGQVFDGSDCRGFGRTVLRWSGTEPISRAGRGLEGCVGIELVRVTGPRIAVLDALAAHPHATADSVAAHARLALGSVSTQAV